MSIGEICVREVDLADLGESVQVAAQRMSDRNVGTLVVLDKHKAPVGIITDRDLALRVVAHGKDPFETTVEEVMTKQPHTIEENAPIESAISAMRAGPFRRIPVVDEGGKLVGLLSMDDVLMFLAEEFGQIGDLLQRENPASLGRV